MSAGLPTPDHIIDTSGRLCPYPVLEVARAVRGLPEGAVILVLATDPGIATDMPMWCQATRHEHLATYRDGEGWKSLVRKRGRKAEDGR